jgi:hypothetical protein
VVVLLESALDLREPVWSPLVGQPLGAAKLVVQLARRGLDVGEIAATTDLDEAAVAGVLDLVPSALILA